jgi:hypothetical protein
MIYWLLVRLVLSAQQDDALISKLGMENRLNNAGYRLISKELETVADCAESIARAVLDLLDRDAELAWPLLRTLREVVHEAATQYGNGLAALVTRDLKLANATARAGRQLEERLNGFMREAFSSVSDPAVRAAKVKRGRSMAASCPNGSLTSPGAPWLSSSSQGSSSSGWDSS